LATQVAPSARAELDEYEKIIASKSFVRFLDYVKITERPGLDTEGGIVLFEKWPHLIQTAEAFTIHRLITVLKARQNGFSWLVAAYAVWLLRFKEAAAILLLSKGENEAAALLEKCKTIYKNLPEEWQFPIDSDSGSKFTLKGFESKILALPSTEDAGRSETATLVVQDEAEFHDHIDANYIAVKPTIDAGGQMIMGSTVNKKKKISLFKNMYKGAPNNGWWKTFWSWKARPDRDDEWYLKTKAEAAELPTAQYLGVDLYMEQEYPATETEALKPSRTVSAFNQVVLDQMLMSVREPIQIIPTTHIRADGELNKNQINIYQGFRIGEKYMCGTDTSHGVGKDYATSVLIDARTGVTVADIFSNTLDHEDLAEDTMQMLEMYRKPIWGIEDNEWGIITIKAAQRAHYPHLYSRKNANNVETVGWHTDERSRYVLYGELISAIHSRHIIIFNKEGLNQFYEVVKNSQKNGRIEAQEGGHDDYPMAVGIAWQLRRYAHTTGNSAPVFTGRRW
jgi:hypothetical protein